MFEQVMETRMTSRLGYDHHGSALSPYLFALVMDEVTGDNKGTSLGVSETEVMVGDFGVQRF